MCPARRTYVAIPPGVSPATARAVPSRVASATGPDGATFPGMRVLLLTHPDFVPPDESAALSAREAFALKTEADVISTLRDLGHEVHVLGVQWELGPIRDAIDRLQPDIVFNLLEEFLGEPAFDHNVVGYLELLRIPYTGCNPRGLMLARGKALAKKLLAYHRIAAPDFIVVPRGRTVRRPKGLDFPLIVKSLTADASLGISKASVVDSDERLAERVRFIHERVGTDAIAERFIEGRELYVSLLGDDRFVAFPPWELLAAHARPLEPLIATERLKHDPVYQERKGVTIRPARDVPPDVATRLLRDAKRIYRILELSGYARLDFRLDAEGRAWFLEANPNPDIARGEEFAEAAAHAGIPYPELLQRLLTLGLRRHR
jgi:D-alanine-D-alanine ligase